MHKYSTLFFLILIYNLCLSSEPEMVTDRPDQTESANIVVPGWLQCETGLVYTNDKNVNYKTDELNIATTLIRLGIVESAELRFEFQYTSLSYNINGRLHNINGFEGLSAGTKINIVKEDDWIPEASFIFHIGLPYGVKEFRKDDYYPDFRLVLEKTINDKIGLASNIGAEWDSGTPTFIYTLTIGYDFTEKFAGFFEIFGDASKISKANHFIHCGIVYNVFNNLQLDASACYGLTEWSDDYYLNTGISFRLPR